MKTWIWKALPWIILGIVLVIRGREADIQHQTTLEVLHRMEIKMDNYASGVSPNRDEFVVIR